MKTLWKEVWAVLLMGVLLPGIILNLSLILLEGNARELPILRACRNQPAETGGCR